MATADVNVYDRYRMHTEIPGFVGNSDSTHIKYRDVPIFVVSFDELEQARHLMDLDVIKNNCYCPLLILTDRRRVLAVDPQGYPYARYVCVIDAETARAIINQV